MKYFFALLFILAVPFTAAYHEPVYVQTPQQSAVQMHNTPNGLYYTTANQYEFHYSYSEGYRARGRCIGNGCAHARYLYGGEGYSGPYHQRIRYNEVYNHIRGNYPGRYTYI
jgi:hypothetical protein